MTRVLSGAVLLIVTAAVVWFAPPAVFLLVAELLVVLGCRELASLAAASRLRVPVVLPTLVAAFACAAFTSAALEGWARIPLDVVLLAAFVAVGVAALAAWTHGPDALASVSAALFPTMYLGLPIGALAAVREVRGREALFLLMLTVAVSDSAQYYSGRAAGRRPLAPAISPKKTIEGAMGGLLFGTLFFAVVGAWWLPATPAPLRIGLGIAIVAAGIAGDLFESMLKRSAGVKDSSALIPGHGGVLDRIDALLFSAPIYYIFQQYF